MDNRDIELFVNLSESESLLGDSMLMMKKIIKINEKNNQQPGLFWKKWRKIDVRETWNQSTLLRSRILKGSKLS